MDDLMKTTQLLIESELRNEELKKENKMLENVIRRNAYDRLNFDNLENENSKLKNQIEYYIQLLHIDKVVAQTKEKYN